VELIDGLLFYAERVSGDEEILKVVGCDARVGSEHVNGARVRDGRGSQA
jgi:hypothetical protein